MSVNIKGQALKECPPSELFLQIPDISSIVTAAPTGAADIGRVRTSAVRHHVPHCSSRGVHVVAAAAHTERALVLATLVVVAAQPLEHVAASFVVVVAVVVQWEGVG